MQKQMLGYIDRVTLISNSQPKVQFKFIECSYTRKITSKSDRIISKNFFPQDYADVAEDTKYLKEDKGVMYIQTVVFLDDELRDRMIRWVEWANKVDPKEYDPFSK